MGWIIPKMIQIGWRIVRRMARWNISRVSRVTVIDGSLRRWGGRSRSDWMVEWTPGRADDIDTERFELTGGTERLQLELGTPRGQREVRIVGGSSTIRIERPARMPVRLMVVGRSGLVLDGTRMGQKGGTTTIESQGWAAATDRYVVEIVGGSKSIEIVARPD